jgi:phage terminase large subunit
MNLEHKAHLNKFQCRWYQKPIWDAIENEGYRKVVVVLPRRAGKDICLWNLAIRQCLKEVCLVQYVLPTYGQANRAIFSAISSSGIAFLDYIPKGLIKSLNASDMKVVFTNGSVLQCVAGDSHDVSIRGTNPKMVILSEYAYMSGEVYNTVSPILAANKGIVVMASTPAGKNHFWHLMQIAKELPEWFIWYKTVYDTQHIDDEDLAQEKKRMSPELFAQEYECSFERGVSGAVFGNCLAELKKNNQITHVAYEPGLLVHCAIDIGVKDATTIIWFQVVGDGTVIRIIDAYSNNGLGLDHYVEVMQKKPYWGRMGKFFAPHDLAVREWGGGAVTRYEKARQLGITFTILPQISIEDSIENAMTHFPKFWIDQTRAKSLVDAIENYYKEWDEEKKMYKPKPVHNWASNYCDALRYMCQAIHFTKRGMSAGEFDRKKQEALYGGNHSNLPRFFDPKFDNMR